MTTHIALGAQLIDGGQARFCVWAPAAERLEVHLLRGDRYIPMTCDAEGYFVCKADDVRAGDHYLYRIDGEKERPDPTSRAQPDGVHEASMVVDPSFKWTDAGFLPPTLRNTVFYELHVGTYTPEGTFEAIIPHLQRLKDFGITTLQIMPVAAAPGWRNWGYDGVYLFAAQSAYGGLEGLQKLVNAAHKVGLAVFLDVVYNHFGPEGNYIWDYAPNFFTDRYRSPWGSAINFDGAGSDHVRRFFAENALFWLEYAHIDGFRVDAAHALFDFSSLPFLEYWGAVVHDWAQRNNRRVYVVAEDDRSDRRLTAPREAHGIGMDAQWLDDLHHTLHVALTGETEGYYADYADYALLPKVLSTRYAYDGQYSPARGRRHGTRAINIPADRFVVATQTHDQVGNRMFGERLSALTDLDGLKLAAALVLTSPYVPMLFMGEEYGEPAPFQFFVDFGDPALISAVRTGRKQEFAAFAWRGDPPDPASEDTYRRSKLDHKLREHGIHAELYAWYGALLKLRREHASMTDPNPNNTRVYDALEARILCMERHDHTMRAYRVYLNFDLEAAQSLSVPVTPDGEWRLCLFSGAENNAPMAALTHTSHAVTLPPKTCAIYEKILEE